MHHSKEPLGYVIFQRQRKDALEHYSWHTVNDGVCDCTESAIWSGMVRAEVLEVVDSYRHA